MCLLSFSTHLNVSSKGLCYLLLYPQCLDPCPHIAGALSALADRLILLQCSPLHLYLKESYSSFKTHLKCYVFNRVFMSSSPLSKVQINKVTEHLLCKSSVLGNRGTISKESLQSLWHSQSNGIVQSNVVSSSSKLLW